MIVEDLVVEIKEGGIDQTDFGYDLYTITIDGCRYNYDIDYRTQSTYLYLKDPTYDQIGGFIKIDAIVKMNEENPAETIERIHKLALLT